MAKTPENEKTNDEKQKAKRTLQIATRVVINKRITTPVTLECRPTHGRSNLNVAVAHRNIFIAMKMKDSTLKILVETKIIDTEL